MVGASELIPPLKSHRGKSYSVAMLPEGPHYYTGLLKAAGYLLLDDKKKKIIILSQQSEDPEDIVVHASPQETTFGKTWKNTQEKVRKIAHEIGAKMIDNG